MDRLIFWAAALIVLFCSLVFLPLFLLLCVVYLGVAVTMLL